MAEEGVPAAPDGAGPKFDLSWMNRSVDPHSADTQAPFVELCKSSPVDAEHTIQRLAQACIECRQTDDDELRDSQRRPTLRVTLLVRDDELELARECLAGADTPYHEDENEIKAEDERRMIANWRCPKCRERTLELEPLPDLVRKILFWGYAALVIAGLVLIQFAMFPVAGFSDGNQGVPRSWFMVLFGAAMLLGALYALFPRTKQCSKCRWEAGD